MLRGDRRDGLPRTARSHRRADTRDGRGRRPCHDAGNGGATSRRDTGRGTGRHTEVRASRLGRAARRGVGLPALLSRQALG